MKIIKIPSTKKQTNTNDRNSKFKTDRITRDIQYVTVKFCSLEFVILILFVI